MQLFDEQGRIIASFEGTQEMVLRAALEGPDEVPLGELSFTELLAVLEGTRELLTYLNIFREKAIVKADATHPHADRHLIGEAADMTPSTFYRVLERNGRPWNRRTDSVPPDLPRETTDPVS